MNIQDKYGIYALNIALDSLGVRVENYNLDIGTREYQDVYSKKHVKNYLDSLIFNGYNFKYIEYTFNNKEELRSILNENKVKTGIILIPYCYSIRNEEYECNTNKIHWLISHKIDTRDVVFGIQSLGKTPNIGITNKIQLETLFSCSNNIRDIEINFEKFYSEEGKIGINMSSLQKSDLNNYCVYIGID